MPCFEKKFLRELHNLGRWVERMYTKFLEDGDRRSAMKRLRVTKSEFESISWATARIGCVLGVCLCFCAMATVLAVHVNDVEKKRHATDHLDDHAFPDDYSRHQKNIMRIFSG